MLAYFGPEMILVANMTVGRQTCTRKISRLVRDQVAQKCFIFSLSSFWPLFTSGNHSKCASNVMASTICPCYVM